jgi:hypothetical protein
MLGLKKIGNKAIKVLRAKNDNNGEISLFDVKELYDAAFAEKDKARVNLKKFKALMAKAEQLDVLYRAQLMQVQPFQYKEVA